MTSSVDLSRLEAEILSRKKYRGLDPALVRQVGLQELARQKNFKESLRSTRARLHQAACAYLLQDLDYASLEHEIATLPRSIQAVETRDFCLRVMSLHASSNERLSILERFSQEIARDLVGIHSVLDCACGLNPLSLPWMPWGMNTRYDACDVFTDMVGFVQHFLEHYGIKGNAWTCDLSRETPAGEYDLVLLLKTLPILEQIEKTSAARLLQSIRGRNLLVSYPVASLGGHQKGMTRNYTRQFESLTSDWRGEIKRFEFETELVFLLIREPPNP